MHYENRGMSLLFSRYTTYVHIYINARRCSQAYHDSNTVLITSTSYILCTTQSSVPHKTCTMFQTLVEYGQPYFSNVTNWVLDLQRARRDLVELLMIFVTSTPSSMVLPISCNLKCRISRGDLITSYTTNSMWEGTCKLRLFGL